MSELSGMEYQNRMVIKKDGQYVDIYMGKWIDQLIKDNASKVVTDGLVETLSLDDPNIPEYKLWASDKMGLTYERPCLSVSRTDVTQLPAGTFEMLRFTTQNGSAFACAPNTPFVTRVNNGVDWLPASQMPVGEMIACSLNNYVFFSTGPVLAQQPVQDYMQVPHIITGTWGEVELTRGECKSGLEICENYPESV